MQRRITVKTDGDTRCVMVQTKAEDLMINFVGIFYTMVSSRLSHLLKLQVKK